MARMPFSLRSSGSTGNSNSPRNDDEHHDIMEEDDRSAENGIEIGDNDGVQVQRDDLDRIRIEVLGKSFDRSEALKKLRSIIHSRYDGDWINFSEVPMSVRKVWFDQFKLSFWWEEGNYEAIKAVWKIKCGEHLRNTFRKARQPGAKKPEWIHDHHWDNMLKKWRSDEKFLRISQTNKRNRAQESIHGCSAYSGGSVSVDEHIIRFKKANKRAPTQREVMQMTYRKKSGEWSGPRAEKSLEVYEGLLAQYQRENPNASGDNFALWVEAVGGVKKGRVFGLGSHVADVPPELLEKYGFASGQPTSTQSQPPMVQRYIEELKKAQADMEGKMENMQTQIMNNVTTQMSYLLTQMSTSPSFSQSLQAAMHPANASHVANLLATGDLNPPFSNLLNPNILAGSTRTMFNSHLAQAFDHNSFMDMPRNNVGGYNGGQVGRFQEGRADGSGTDE